MCARAYTNEGILLGMVIDLQVQKREREKVKIPSLIAMHHYTKIHKKNGAKKLIDLSRLGLKKLWIFYRIC